MEQHAGLQSDPSPPPHTRMQSRARMPAHRQPSPTHPRPQALKVRCVRGPDTRTCADGVVALRLQRAELLPQHVQLLFPLGRGGAACPACSGPREWEVANGDDEKRTAC